MELVSLYKPAIAKINLSIPQLKNKKRKPCFTPDC